MVCPLINMRVNKDVVVGILGQSLRMLIKPFFRKHKLLSFRSVAQLAGCRKVLKLKHELREMLSTKHMLQVEGELMRLQFNTAVTATT
jgi:hypothetical protein